MQEPANSTTRKERDRIRREDDFLAAAARLFAEKGYRETGMEDIARLAEYGTGTIYRYFKSKEDLYQELLFRKLTDFSAVLRERVEGEGTARGKLRALVTGQLDFFRANLEFLSIMLGDNIFSRPGGCPVEEGRCAEVLARYETLARAIFVEGMERGEFRRLDPDLLVSAFVGLMDHCLFETMDRHGELREEELRPFLLGFLERAILAEGEGERESLNHESAKS